MAWAITLAQTLTRWKWTPNQISCLSILVALLGGISMLGGAYVPSLFLAAAVFIQTRLLCNMMDGMVAIEGHHQTPIGPVFNELPDRIADVFLLVPLGYVIHQPWVGWAIAALALICAYVRALGASLGQPQDFSGPMAKPHRMAMLSAGCLAGAVEAWVTHTEWLLSLTAAVLLLGTAWTIVRRTRNLTRHLNSQVKA